MRAAWDIGISAADGVD